MPNAIVKPELPTQPAVLAITPGALRLVATSRSMSRSVSCSIHLTIRLALYVSLYVSLCVSL